MILDIRLQRLADCGAIARKDYVIFYDKTQTLVALKFLWSLIQMMAYLFGSKPSPEPM